MVDCATGRLRASYRAILPNSSKGKHMTIYQALKAKLGREPSHRELCNEVKRILAEARQ
jgi:hypothetical protein